MVGARLVRAVTGGPAPIRLNPHQRRAVDPARSVWVTASAGTGKTRVLASRIARLLLDGCKPHRILALTFTNAAAAEMSNRVSETLAEWSVSPEPALAETIHELTGETPTKERIDEARRCFATLLDDPIGLRAHTIHGFCQSLLRRFPIEAGIPPHFSLIDERTRAELLSQSADMVISGKARSASLDDTTIPTLADYIDLDKALALATTLMGESDRLSRLPSTAAELQRAYENLLGLDPGQSAHEIIAAASADSAFDGAGLARVAALLSDGSPTYQRRGQAIADWLAAGPDGRAARFSTYAKRFAVKDKSLLTNSMRSDWSEAQSVIEREADRVRRAAALVNLATLTTVNSALTRFAIAVGGVYERLKRQRAFLDYDDLIGKATALLTRADARAWVLYKLDGGIDHILVDEAQDNSRPQWQIFNALADELVGGTGIEPQTPAGRSLFVVGDPKQSIYRFQGAAPDAFQETRERIEHQLGDAPPEDRLDVVELTTSFRSAEPILSFVDAVLSDPAMPEAAFPSRPPHRPFNPKAKPGLVEIWPLLRQAKRPDPEPWPLPDRYDLAEKAEQRLAIGVAEQIQRLTSDDEAPVQPEDVLVLVKKRSAFFSMLINELKNRAIPVEGADRLILSGELAVRDLLVLGDFVLQRDDDLALATVLRGPLIGISEEGLFDLAHGRGDARLWDRLTAAGETDAYLKEVESYLGGLLAVADFLTPHAFFAAVLTTPCPADKVSGRRAMTTRLGRPINDPVDELLNQALTFETDHVAGLQGFLHWIRLSDDPLKRAAGDTPAGVRVMTIHGAKGLEANTVVLADIDGRPPRDDAVFWAGSDQDRADLPLWRPVKEITCDLIEDHLERRRIEDDAEEMRLLYVALTRAQERLYVCGTGPESAEKNREERWYHFCERAMERLEPVHTIPFGSDADPGWSGERRRFALRERLFQRAGSRRHIPADLPLDHWSRQPAPAARPSPIVRPSRWTEDDAEPAPLSPASTDGHNPYRRGLMIHTLLERLPALPGPDRRAAGLAYLTRPIHGLSQDQAISYVDEALEVIDDPQFGPIFTPDALVEAPIVGQAGGTTINGQIDRLVIGEKEILIVDFKTNRPPPTDIAHVAPVYLRQMGAYWLLLRQIFPEKIVKCALLWTAEPRLMPLPENTLANVMSQSGS